MDMYAIATRPLIDKLAAICEEDILKQGWYADDSISGGSLDGIEKWFKHLCILGPDYGYYPNIPKCVLIVKNEEDMEKAKEIFGDTEIKITLDGDRHLGAVIGSEAFRESYIKAKVDAWIKDVIELSDIAKEEPQVALAAYTRGLCRRWTYTQRTVGGISEMFTPLETVLRQKFIPALLNKQVNDLERRIIALPVRHGGLGIQDPSETSDFEYSSSIQITEGLTDIICSQKNSLHDLYKSEILKVNKKSRKKKKTDLRKSSKESVHYWIHLVKDL